MSRRRRTQSEFPSTYQNFLELRADYDAAKSSRFRRRRTGVSAMGSGADYHLRSEPRYLAMMELARDIMRNNPLVAQGVRRLVANVMQGGFTMDPQTGNADADSWLADRWRNWSTDPEQCDRSGEHDFHAMERLTFQSHLVDGDMLALPLKEGSLQLIEAHRVRTPRNTSKNVVLGVKLDDFRRREQYWVTKDEIDPIRPVQRVSDIKKYDVRDPDPKSETYGQRQVFHLYDPDRVSQTRGVTAFAGIADTAGMGDDLMFAQLLKAQVAASYAIFREYAVESLGPTASFSGPADVQRGDRETETRPDGSSRTLEGIAPGMEIFGFPGEKLQGFSPNVPNQEFFQHAMLILTIVAVNLDLPLAVFLLDPTKTNFSGWRGAMDQAKLRFRHFQDRWRRIFHGPAYRWKVRQWQSEDRVLRALRDDALKHRFIPPSWPYIEPLKDRQAELLAVRNALTSQRRRCAERNLDWDDLSTEIVADNAAMIVKAHEKALELNKKYADLAVTWREVACLPTPDGVNVSVGDQTPQNEESQNAA